MFRKSELTTFYIAIQLIGVFFAIQPTLLIDSSLLIRNALILHLLAIIFFILGTNLPALSIKAKIETEYLILIKHSFYVYCISITLFGLLISFSQISSFTSISNYFSLLINNDSALTEIRDESASGGLGGILKMFSFGPLSIYLLSEGILHFYSIDEINANKLKKLKYFALIISLVKVFIWLDRLTLLAICVTNLYIFINKKGEKYFIRTFVIAGIVLFIGNYISARRLDGYNIFDFIILYTKLGLVNFEIMIKTVNHFTFGFNSFLGPLLFILKFFGIPLNINNSYDFIWNPAQYMNSYLYQDFGILSLIIYIFIGWFIKNIDYWVAKKNKHYVVLFFTFLFAFSTFWFVPIIRAVEFWLMLVIPLVSLKFISFQKILDDINEIDD